VAITNGTTGIADGAEITAQLIRFGEAVILSREDAVNIDRRSIVQKAGGGAADGGIIPDMGVGSMAITYRVVPKNGDVIAGGRDSDDPVAPRAGIDVTARGIAI